ncbi:MAG TPA: hypothetical protein VG755_32015 [Nannocystaceae bacterium]|nr:hypothetical protein [Nannocystaceae bacterium]
MQRILIALFVALAACTSAVEPTKPSTPTPAPTPTPTKPAPVGDATQQWACKTDGECTQTCALGAVSAAWIAAHPDADSCDDGCGWKYGKQACRDGECVTLDDKGGIDASCTKRPYEPAAQ